MPEQPKQKQNKQPRQVQRKGKRQEKKKKIAKALSNVKEKKEVDRVTPDVRTGVSDQTQQVAAVKGPTVVALTTGGSFLGVALAYVSLALQKGYLANAPDPSYPFWAMEYMKDILLNYANGVDQTAVSMPYWFLCLCQALSPKSAKYERSEVSYSFYAGTGTSNGVVPIGPPSYGESWYACQPGTGTVEGFPTGTNPAPYSVENGQLAWASLGQFMIDKSQRWREKMTRIVSANEKTLWTRDVSAYAASLVSLGGGMGSGGWSYQAQSEVSIFAPMLSVFTDQTASPSDATNVARWPTRIIMGAGDSLTLTGKMSLLYPEFLWKSKTYDVFKCVDFLQAGDIMAKTFVAMLTNYLAYAPNNLIITEGSPPLSTLQCPLSLQEFLILLRNEITFVFASTICFTQSIYPNLPDSAGVNRFIAYIEGSNTVPLASCGMKLPLPFVENLKSLVSRTAMQTAQNGLIYGAETWYPVLGQYYQDKLTSTDYAITTATEDPQTLYIFNQNPSILTRKRKESKAKSTPVLPPKVDKLSVDEEWVQEAAEVEIDLIAGTAGGAPVFINDVNRLATLAALYNSWVMQYQSCIDPLTTVSAGQGSPILTSLGLTRHWAPPTTKQLEREATYQDARLIKKRKVSTLATPYSTREVLAVTSQGGVISEAWTFQSRWLLPVNYSVSGSTANDQSLYARMQLASKEPFSVPNSSTGDGSTIDDLNTTYATSMTHAFQGPPSDMARFFMEEDAKGQGGILSSLAAQLARSVLGNTAGNIADAVADVLPI